MNSVNIAAYLPQMAQTLPHGHAVIVPFGKDALGRYAYTHYTFEQLNRACDRAAVALEGYGVRRGMRTVLMVTPSLDFFALTFALFKIGAVPVFVDPGMGVKNLKVCLGEAEPQAFIGIPKAHVGRVLLRWPSPDLKVTVGKKLFWGGVTFKDLVDSVPPDTVYEMAETAADEHAAILFTSGSTGPPKGAVYSHGMFDAQVRQLKRVYGIAPGEMDLATFPLFALFGPALGMAAVIPEMDFTRPADVDPVMVAQLIEDFGVTNMFGSPALLNRVSQHAQAAGLKFASLKRVISAGAPVHASVMRRFVSLLAEGSHLHTPYGATESLPIATISSAEVLDGTERETAKGAGVCVGRPVPDMDVRIIGISDDVIAHWRDDLQVPDGEIGEVVVRGAVVSPAYYNREAATRVHKIYDGDEGFFHRVGDLAYFGKDGRLWFCGRKKHRVLTEDGLMFTVPVEGIFNTHPAVYRSALVGVILQNKVQPIVCIELFKEHQQRAHEILPELKALAANHELTKSVHTILFHPSFPVDIRHNAKIFREKLAVWAAQTLKAKPAATTDLSSSG